MVTQIKRNAEAPININRPSIGDLGHIVTREAQVRGWSVSDTILLTLVDATTHEFTLIASADYPFATTQNN